MDIQRKDVSARKKKRLIVIMTLCVVAVAVVGFGLGQLEAPVYRVDESSVWVEEVQRGALLREVSGIGTLVPKNTRLITATSGGIVEELIVFPGTKVEPDSVILRMSNPELLLESENARLNLTAAEADFNGLKIQLQGSLLQMEANMTQLKANFEQAKLRSDVNEKLNAEGLVAELTFLQSQLEAKQLMERVELEKRRFAFQKTSNQSQIEMQEAQLQNVRGRYRLLQEQVDKLEVKAGSRGVLQRLLVEEGQRVSPGALLAQAADPTLLKGVIQISETQAKDITIGQMATVDTRNGIVNGHVMRIDPSVQNGTVAVDIELPLDLPRGARPDLTVEGRIELENLADVIYVARPAFARENGTVGIFKYEADSSYAIRTNVEFGKSSVSSIEVISGLEPGDRIIASDTSQFEDYDKVQVQ